MATYREKGREGRREDIIRAALEVFGDKGIFSARIEEVAAAAGIGKGTVYEYFRSKDELISASIRYEMEEFANMVKDTVDREETVRAKLKAMVEAVILHHRQNRHKMLDINPATVSGSMKDLKALFLEQNARWLAWLEEIIDAGVASGEIRRVNPQLLLGALMGAVMNLARPWGNPGWEDSTPAEAGEQVADLFLGGIGRD